MLIQSLILKNYRSFVDPTTIELRPMTLLFGYNNSGKSALLRALPLVADSFNGQSRTPLALDSPAVRGSHFRDLLSYVGSDQGFDLELSLADSEIHRLKWTLRGVLNLRAYIVSNFTIFNETTQVSGHIESSTDKNLSNEYNVQLVEDGAIYKKILNLKFEGLLPSLLPRQDSKVLPAKLVSIIEQCQKLKNINTRIQWLGAVRQPPLRNNPFQGAYPKYLEPEGQGAADILAYESIFEELLILPKVSRWYENHFQQKIVVEEIADHFQIKLQYLANLADKVNIVDMGEGLIQVLPVLVACARASEGEVDILAIEEPESHLHPRFHAALAAHFCELTRQNNPPTVLLETHS